MDGNRAEAANAELVAEIEARITDEAEPAEELEAAVEEQVEEPAEIEAAETEEDAGEGDPELESADEAAEETPKRRSWREALGDDIDWDGFDQAKLDELPSHMASQRQYLSRLANEYHNKLKELEARAEAPESPAPQPEADLEPPMPSFDDDQATFMQKMQAREAWVQREAVRQAEQKLAPMTEQLSEVRQTIQQQQAKAQEEMVAKQVESIRAACGGDEEVFNQIGSMFAENPEYEALGWKESGIRHLVTIAKAEVEGRRGRQQDVARKTTAAKRSINPPKPKGSVAKTEKTISGDSIEDELMQIANLDQHRHLFGD